MDIMLKWKVSAGKLFKACNKTFELENRVLIRPKTKYSGTDTNFNGIYIGLVGRVPNQRHVIYIDTNLSMQEANETLWHELTHAYQYEKNEIWRKNFKLQKGCEYSRNPSINGFDEYYKCHPEQHARKMAEEMSRKVMLLYKTIE
jgi:hypothetical protein